MLWWVNFKARCAAARSWAWCNRTKIAGYLGIIGGSVQMGLEQREHLGMIILGAGVAAIGHYNDRRRDS